MLDESQIRDLLAAASVRSACAGDRARLDAALRGGVMRYGKRSERERLRDEERSRERLRAKWRRSSQQRRAKARDGA